MQWIDGVLSRGDKAEFFHDEFRCPVYVKDVVTIIQALTSRWISGNKSLVLAVTIFNIACWVMLVTLDHCMIVKLNIRSYMKMLIKVSYPYDLEQGGFYLSVASLNSALGYLHTLIGELK